jgi:hypothetical protein
MLAPRVVQNLASDLGQDPPDPATLLLALENLAKRVAGAILFLFVLVYEPLEGPGERRFESWRVDAHSGSKAKQYYP